MTMDQISNDDRRNAPRFDMRIPLKLMADQGPMPAFTRDVSATGIYFFMQMSPSFNPGQPVEFIITFPPEITLTTNINVKCAGEIIRTHANDKQGVGIAVKINSYEFLATAHA